jgi:hypothetical protein
MRNRKCRQVDWTNVETVKARDQADDGYDLSPWHPVSIRRNPLSTCIYRLGTGLVRFASFHGTSAKYAARVHALILRQMEMQIRLTVLIFALGLSGITSAFASPVTPMHIPLVSSGWQASGNATFIAQEGFPNGILHVTSESEAGFVALKDKPFENGTIEFDMKPVGEDMPGIRFHQQDSDTADMLYVRVGPNCPASQDCLQYVPIVKGRVLWDVYPQYQAAAPFRENEWNHIRLVISGKRLNVFVNGRTEPSLRVAHLEGDARTGTIAFEGPAFYANLILSPGVTDGLDPKPAPDPAAGDRRYLVHWQGTDPVSLGAMDQPRLSNLSPSASSWTPVTADYGGLINLSRFHASTLKHQPRQVIWLRTTVQSDRDQIRHVSVGWLREIWIFADGKPVFSGKNLYNVKGGRKAPDGRLSLENDSFDLSLQKGANEIVVAIDDNTPDMRGRYGWGFIMCMDQADGIAFGRDTASSHLITAGRQHQAPQPAMSRIRVEARVPHL